MSTAFQQFLKGQDKMAKTTTITYNSKKSYGTTVGGICSLLINIFLLSALSIEIISLIQNPQFS